VGKGQASSVKLDATQPHTVRNGKTTGRQGWAGQGRQHQGPGPHLSLIRNGKVCARECYRGRRKHGLLHSPLVIWKFLGRLVICSCLSSSFLRGECSCGHPTFSPAIHKRDPGPSPCRCQRPIHRRSAVASRISVSIAQASHVRFALCSDGRLSLDFWLLAPPSRLA